MRRKFVFLFFILLFLISGCSWLALLDTNPYDDVPVGYKQYHEQKIEEIRQALLGLSKEEVLIRLGKPAWVNEIGDNHQRPTKFRENQYVFDGTKKCRMSECGGPIFEDESWAYSWEERSGRYYSQHGFGVFFKNGIVVAVE